MDTKPMKGYVQLRVKPVKIKDRPELQNVFEEEGVVLNSAVEGIEKGDKVCFKLYNLEFVKVERNKKEESLHFVRGEHVIAKL